MADKSIVMHLDQSQSRLEGFLYASLLIEDLANTGVLRY